MGATSQLRMLRVLTQSLVDQEPPDLDILELAFRVLAKAVHRDLADALTVQGVLLNPICQEEPYDPGREVSINPNENSILTP